MMIRMLGIVRWFFLATLLCVAQSMSLALAAAVPAQSGEKVPIMDGGAGPCSLELTVNGPDGKPVYAAIIKVHIAYGFDGIRRLDLEAGTNSEGKVKFTGVPARVHRPPLEFHASKDDLEGVATYNPSSECEAHHDIALRKAKTEPGQ
jgi:hypothetical protein